jgi:SAM-dependent methyltransferase
MTWDPVWEAVYRSRTWGQYPGEDVVRFVKGNFANAPDRGQVCLLEVGSGAGANLWFMAREGFCVHGIDASETAVGLTRERLDRECEGWQRAGGRVQVGELTDLPYPDDFFDAVLDVVAVCYCDFDEARRAYSELARVTKVGGRLFSRAFERGCWGDGTGVQAGHNAWRCSEGPLQGLGATRFTDEDDLGLLLEGWAAERVERARLTMDGGRHEIRHLLIEAVKPQARNE